MGLFDHLSCQAPLPVAVPEGLSDWQTKDTPAQYLWTYEITAQGQLWEHGWPAADHPPRRLAWHGDICFYQTHRPTNESFEFIARFSAGQLVRIWRVPDDAGGWSERFHA